MLQVGDVLVGRYEIEALLGEGGMGAVFRAKDTLKERLVALKEFRLGDLPSESDLTAIPDGTRGRRKTPGTQTREDAFKLFKKEAKLLSGLEHPNLPQVFDYFSLGAEAYIVMTLIEGKSLADLLEENGGPLPEDQVTGWLLQALDALTYCHGRGVIHRDLKPENLLLTQGNKIFLIDFGIAKALNPGQQATSTGVPLLTVGYSPPEQYSAGEGSADPRTDLYSLGAAAYTLLTGTIPPESTLRAGGTALPAPRSLNPAISKRMEVFIQRCMQLNRENRPQTAAEAARLLGKQEAPPPKPQPAPTPAPRPRLKLPWRKILVGVGGAALLGLLVWLVVAQVIPEIKVINENRQFTRTAIVATNLAMDATHTAVEATRRETARLATVIAGWTKTPTQTASPTQTRTPTFTLTPAYTSTFTPTPTSPLIPPDCTRIGQEWVSPLDGMTLVCVPAGKFTMGSDSYSDDESPAHSVTLDAFWIDGTEVTNAQYAWCVAAGDCSAPASNNYNDLDYASHPVVTVSWYDAEKYCTWADRALPTEAQWEKAARGADQRIYPWGNELDCKKVNGGGSDCDGFSNTAPVGSFPAGASPYGALDMAGNVWEWVKDWYDSNYYDTYPKDGWPDNPTGPEGTGAKVLRGGSWNYYYSNLRSSYRDRYFPDYRYAVFGFRCSRGTSP